MTTEYMSDGQCKIGLANSHQNYARVCATCDIQTFTMNYAHCIFGILTKSVHYFRLSEMEL